MSRTIPQTEHALRDLHRHALRIVTEGTGWPDWSLMHAASYSDDWGSGDMLTLGHTNMSGETVTVQVRITVPGAADART